jgi:hypothetical protein
LQAVDSQLFGPYSITRVSPFLWIVNPRVNRRAVHRLRMLIAGDRVAVRGMAAKEVPGNPLS